MRTLQVTDDLILEIWPSGGEGERPLVKLRSLAAERDGEAIGAVIIYPEELDALVAALTEAAACLAGGQQG